MPYQHSAPPGEKCGLVIIILTPALALSLLTVPPVFPDHALFIPAILTGIGAVTAVIAPLFAAILPSVHALSSR